MKKIFWKGNNIHVGFAFGDGPVFEKVIFGLQVFLELEALRNPKGELILNPPKVVTYSNSTPTVILENWEVPEDYFFFEEE